MSLRARAVQVLETAEPAGKVHLSLATAGDWRAGRIGAIGRADPPDRPARPARPRLTRPGDMPRRNPGGSAKGRVALLHALAHIELNAIDLAWDLIARFAGEPLPCALCDDWVGVAAEEAKHFELLAGLLAGLVGGLAGGLLGAAGRRKGRFARLPLAGGWTDHRDFPAPEGRTFHQLWRARRGAGGG